MADNKRPATGMGIIRYRGEPNKAQFMGQVIVRKSHIYLAQMQALIPCTPYGEHFIFEVPFIDGKEIKGPSHMCTCGSNSVVKDPELLSRIFICFLHQILGKHQTSFLNKDDFAKLAAAGITLQPKGIEWMI